MRYLSLILILTLFAGNMSADNKNNFKWIKEIRYEQIRPYSDGLSAFKQNDKWGYLDVNGKVVVTPAYDDCKDFSNGVAAVNVEGRWGFIDATGRVIIRPSFEDCRDFENNHAIVKQNGKWGVIDKNGKSVAGFIFDNISDFSNGFAYANNGTIPYFIKQNGQAQKLSREYTYGKFSEGLAPVKEKKSGKWGYIDSKGVIAIEPLYDTVTNFSNGVALVKRKGEFQYITDKGGKKNIEVPSWQELKFVNGFAKIKKASGVTFIDSDFNMLPLLAKEATDFNEQGIAVLLMFDKSVNYIDKNGKVIYLGTFSRSIAPAIRVSYMVLPEKLIDHYRLRCEFMSCTVPKIDQMILQKFIEQAYFERHLNKMRGIYKNRHDVLLNHLKPLMPHCRITGEHAGVHLLLHFENGRKEEELISSAAEHGIRVYGLSRYGTQQSEKNDATILLGYANMTETDIIEATDILCKLWK